MRARISFTLQRNLCSNMRRMQLLGCSPQKACSGGPAGFISTYLYSSKLFEGELLMGSDKDFLLSFFQSMLLT